jgi:DNA repair exonuclease SbcCD nuclease subunit
MTDREINENGILGSFENPIKANGFLFIGDVHLTSRKPDRRHDDYQQSVLKKIEFVLTVANNQKLIPVFLGDIFHYASETSKALETALTRILRKSWTPPLSNVGNHDISHKILCDDDSLALLAESGVIIAPKMAGPVGYFSFHGQIIGLYFVPYGQIIPKSIKGEFKEGINVVMVTHHDIAFEGAYPGAHKTHPIEGCQLVVNGHMHLYKDPIWDEEDTTMWFNPGSLTRTAIDAITHSPTVWSYYPDMTDPAQTLRLDPWEVEFKKDVFDMTGKRVAAINPETPVDIGDKIGNRALTESRFAKLIAEVMEAEPKTTDEGVNLREEIKAQFLREKTKLDIKTNIIGLYREVVGITQHTDVEFKNLE